MKEKYAKGTKFVLNYHLHVNQGGVGHVSLTGTHNGETVNLSVYPSEKLSVATPVVVSSMYVFPSLAENHDTPRKGDSPIYASYDITDLLPNKAAALEEMKEISRRIDSGHATFSITPNFVTQTTSAVFNPNSSTSNMMLGFKTFERDKIEKEIDKIQTLNCAEATSRVLKKGGMERPPGLLSYATPSGIHEFFESKMKEAENAELEQSQESSTEVETGFMRSFFGKVKDFFSPQETQPSETVEEYPMSTNDSTSYQDWSSETVELSSKDEEPESEASATGSSEYTFDDFADEVAVELSSNDEEPEKEASSQRASESTSSFFAQGAGSRTLESDEAYTSRIDAIFN
ncbi:MULTISPECIES: hypothetical protein [Legionella]|uniref:Uncharacterized protein n=1 Tax=Legionella drozanskii LLAP-1 TaxID=1212489 RepID=A0A0W0SRW8_9GAMM|nr:MULTISPECIES: hypothetical protein [Legionella]KTC86151.1 hypothetical protein Ldro_2476 [Legionella drozanskii LLAP-1]PJE17688.1 MAG: hypothetical protein CK430_01860 [Legionella sp.]